MNAIGVAGSFRDPAGRVYEAEGRILRGVDAQAAANFDLLQQTNTYRAARERGTVVASKRLGADHPVARPLIDAGWAAVIEHDRVPLISYPYEWSFSMLKDAALLQLDLLDTAFDEGWTLKDSTPFNIQFVDAKPIFIDIPSFVPRGAGEPWLGYRQFCMLYLFPLMLTAYRGIPFQGILRANLDGITPIEMARYFSGWSRFKKGVLSHVLFPAAMEKRVEATEKDRAPAKRRAVGRQKDILVKSLIASMRRLVASLDIDIKHTAWSEYSKTHSYEEDDFRVKKEFVRQAAEAAKAEIVWDIGSNTGEFSKICAQSAKHVIAVDGDHDAVDILYREMRGTGNDCILPLIMNLANISPNHGWAGVERLAFDQRNRPDLVIALALIHHMALSANIPIFLFIEWLASLEAELVIEFVDRDDEMVQKLLTNKKEQYQGYNKATFIAELEKHFSIVARAELKGGTRELFQCVRRTP